MIKTEKELLVGMCRMVVFWRNLDGEIVVYFRKWL